jgi:hypothetical protein
MQRQPGRLVGVAVQPHHRPAPAEQLRHRVLEEPWDEGHALLEPESREVALHLLERDREVVRRAEALLPVRLGKALEGVGHPHRAITRIERVKRGSHQDRRTAAPCAGLDQVPGDAVAHHRFDSFLKIVETVESDHREALPRPVHPRGAHAKVGGRQLSRRDAAVLQLPHRDSGGPREVTDRELEQIKVCLLQTHGVRARTRRTRRAGLTQA